MFRTVREVVLTEFEEPLVYSANVLVVDDDPAILRLFTHLLEQGGHQVRTATDGNQAIHQILQDCPDILITDWTMPGLGGVELCRRVRQLHQRKVLPHYTYILLLTARSGTNLFIEGLEAGADDFVEKAAESLTDLRIEIRARLKAALRTRRLERDLDFAAKYDTLTQLLKRTAFFELAQVIWERSIKNKFPLSAVMFDCDFFKRINDLHGHLTGDAVLREMAQTLKTFSRSSDVACRYSGKKFCILLPGCNEETARNWAERIRCRFETVPIRHGNFEIPVTASFGIAERLDDTIYLDQLIERADLALVFAKETGYNRCVRYTETIALDFVAGDLQNLNDLFEGCTLDDVMAPLTMSVKSHETVSRVADFFLRTRSESIPVLDDEDRLLGLLWDEDIVKAIGNTRLWRESVRELVVPNAVTYPVDTPLTDLFHFFFRTNVRQVIVMQERYPVGVINRFLLLRWLRNRWAALSGLQDAIMPGIDACSPLSNENLSRMVATLADNLAQLNEIAHGGDPLACWEENRSRVVPLISKAQDVLDQLLKFDSKNVIR
ncbi:MAG TPA: hypothetical protein DEB39_05680 [Planctomycetaceae bacterium]|nr:hypothetical protein [Planctomycetaceae bacterium]